MLSSSPSETDVTPIAAPASDVKNPEPGPFESMRDLRCPLAIQLGTGSLTVRQCLELKPGSILTLSQHAGEELELRVNDVLIGYGEVLILEDLTSFRVTQLAPAERTGV